MNRLGAALSCILLLASSNHLLAAEMPVQVSAGFQQAGVPVYPGAVYCTGDARIGVRLASSHSPEKVRQWYRERLPGWQVFEQFGMWVLHPGKANPSMSELMEGNQVSVVSNPQIPEWHALDANMTTEIMVALPKTGAPTSLVIPARSIELAGIAIDSIERQDVIGAMERAGDVEGNRGDYYYIQTEDYLEYPLAYESQVNRETWDKLEALADSAHRVRASGAVVVLDSGDIMGFDPNQPIEIFVEDD
jgi:hypothetical protein